FRAARSPEAAPEHSCHMADDGNAGIENSAEERRGVSSRVRICAPPQCWHSALVTYAEAAPRSFMNFRFRRIMGVTTNNGCPMNCTHHLSVIVGGRCTSVGMTTSDMTSQIIIP